MSIFSRKKPKEEVMTTYSPGMEYQPTQQEVVIDGIKRAADNFGGMIYNPEPQVQQPQMQQPAQQVPQVPQRPIQQPQMQQPAQPVFNTDAIIDAFNEVEQRLNAIEARLFRRGL